ncbi:esterase FE4-like [Hyposmocoma kahamanoa]|uniref:esterase FE4-like n=1 Tax=Hyposmocoma kahamanoa TaxID=1477025 RepID=UPI000E6D848B|nr:esterase FE4-like [Hyposmocoma kahamanoa]
MYHQTLCIVIFFLINVTDARGSVKTYTSGNGYRDVNATEGMIRGHVVDEGNYEYLAFYGVPYAAPPVGNMRFKPPLPLGPWDGVKVANRKVKCPQNGEGEEDCLVLNIFTPLKIINGPLPVLVYFHGGSFIMGSAHTEGMKHLIQQNIIVVTVNYRLGALGFLCLGIKEAPGNSGLKDQVAALRWINRNINEFGGDPKKVTIYGMSAGAASTEYHVLSHMSKGLFQQAIVESGSATPVWAIDAQPIETALNLAIGLNVSTGKNLSRKSVYKMLNSFLKLPANLISKVNMEYYNNLTDGTFGFVPCVERHVPGREPFICRAPYHILTREQYSKVPMMFIYSSAEGLFLRSSDLYELNYAERMNANFFAFLPADLQFDSKEITKQIAENILNFYFGYNGTIGDDVMQYLNYFGDYLVMHSLLNSVEIHSKKNNPVYLMEFAYKGGLGSYDKFYENIYLAGHGDAMKYVLLNKPALNPDDKLIVRRMTKLLANFVKFGNPTPERTDLLPFIWPRVQPRNVSYLLLNNDIQIYEEPHWGRKAFWNSLYNKFRKTVKPVNPGF